MPLSRIKKLLLLTTIALPLSAYADDSVIESSTENREQNTKLAFLLNEKKSQPIKSEKQQTGNTSPDFWGLALTLRSAEIPYPIDVDTENETVSDLIPLLFYEKGRFYWRGLEAGYNVIDNYKWTLGVLGRYRYFDIPSQYQNELRGNGTDVGIRYRYNVSPQLNVDVDLMDDTYGRSYVNIRSNYTIINGDWDILPSLDLRWKSSEFNNHYYGLDTVTPGNDFDLTAGATVRYHVHRNLYLLARGSVTQFAPDTYRASTVRTPNQTELYVGFGFFEDKRNLPPKGSRLKSQSYIRVADGTATPSNLGDLVKGNREPDPYNNKLTSVFYGVPVSDTFFGINMPIYFTPGYIWHHSSIVQGGFPEYVVAIKGFYTIKWPTRWRLGVAEGLSYTRDITYVEQSELDQKGYRPSNLLNYMDFSVGVDLGDLFNSKMLKNTWFGYSIHHRSGIFESSSVFGRIKGGSNYTTLYVQYQW